MGIFYPDPRIDRLLRWSGTHLAGDVGGLTVYTTRRGKRVVYPAAPPKEPPSADQLHQRARFRAAVLGYLALDGPTRAKWELLAQTLGLVATGQNLWIHLALTPDRTYWETARARAHSDLVPPAFIP